MPYSFQQYTGNGSTATFTVPFPYLLRSHVRLYYGLNLVTGGYQTLLVDGTNYSWTNGTTVQLTVPPPNGTVLTIRRETPTTSRLVDWSDGSNMTAADMDTADLQNFYAIQEHRDFIEGTTITPTANVADGSITANKLSTDAVTTSKIADGAITSQKIADDAITSQKIADGAIVDAGVNAAAGIAASKLAFTQTGTGAVARTVESKFCDTVSVKDFGAIGNGVANDTAAIQAAIDSLPASGGSLYFPAGYYNVGALNLNKSARYYGDGYATVIQANSATADIFTVSAQGVTVHGMRFISAVPRIAGKYVMLTSTDASLSVFWMSGAFHGVEVAAGTAVVTIANGSIRDTVAANGIPILISGGFDISIRDIIMDNNAAAQPLAGIYIASTGDTTIEDCNIIRCGNCLALEAATGKVIASVWANNCFFDTAMRGALIRCVGGSIVRAMFSQCWFSSHATQGVHLEGLSGLIDGVDFNGCHFFLNQLDGLNIYTTLARNIAVLGGAFAQNGGSGVSVAPDVSEFSIQGARLGSGYGLAGNSYGIFINSGSGNNYRIFNNDLRGNTILPLANAANGASAFIMGNLGHNPKGLQGIVVGPSPFSYTAGNTPEAIHINGGIVSLVQVNGANVFLQTNCTVRLGPKQTITVAYTAAPGMTTAID